MRDRILEAYLADFSESHGLQELEVAEAFEYFVNYCVVSRYFPDQFEPEDVSVGGSGDLGLDGIAILVNENLVSSVSDVDYFRQTLRRLDVQFHFVQSKLSARFEAAQIGNFADGVRAFLRDKLPRNANDEIRELHEVKEHIYSLSIDMDAAPSCHLHYVTTGKWQDDPNVVDRMDQAREDIGDTGLFAHVEFMALDAERLKTLHRELHRKITRELVFEKHTILPNIDGVQEAYLGTVPCTEYLKILTHEDGSLDRRLFYDNVRDFQGNNAVNMEIQETLEDGQRSDRFALLNNGVTIVAGDVNKVGATFRLRDFQIVNGCQTSHVLYLSRALLNPSIHVPVKLIVSNDTNVISDVIQGTNRQTEVKLEAFESLAPFQKQLEELYVAMGRTRQERLYYERRSKQYEHLGLRREDVVTLPTQIKCFVAMFLNEPHSTHRYYGELLQSYRTRLFSESHSPLPYYISGAAHSALEWEFSTGQLPRAWRRFKYQILMAFRVLAEAEPMPPINTRRIEQYCDRLLEVLDSEAQCSATFEQAGSIVQRVLDGLEAGADSPDRTRRFTTEILDAAGDSLGAGGTSRLEGYVKEFSEARGFGFITGDDGAEYFVHYSEIQGEGHRSLVPSQRVTFEAVQADKGPRALDVASIGRE